jgi:CBS domain-containing protein
MRVEDVMTREVVTVGRQTSLKAVAEILATRRISGLPVVEDGRVLGVVSEADIVEKEAGRPTPGALERLRGRTHASAKSSARTAGEAMTSPALTVSPLYDVARAAWLMAERRINRLPVVAEDGELVGIVTRADLVGAFARSDEEIARELREDVVVGALWMDPKGLEIAVEDGGVTLSGEVDQKPQAELLERFAARVPGVVSVRSELRWRVEKPKVAGSDPHVPQPPRSR